MRINRFELVAVILGSGWPALAAASVVVMFAPQALAQAPAAASAAVLAPSAEELDRVVGPIALYPDDLVAIVLPAATNPLQLVQAERYLDKRKADPKLPVDEKWDDAVKSLLNYPDIVKMMSGDLDWTTALGEAVVTDQGAVLDAIQSFRRKTQSAGNLKTDDKQVVVVETEVIKIVPADPQVIYVPQYNPSTVVAYSAAPVYGYYPAPYPSYYYPYPPGAALATGIIWGAALGAVWNGGHYGTNWGGSNNNITINRNTNINRNANVNTGNINTGNVNRSDRASAQPAGTTAWKSNKQPGQVGASAGSGSSTARVGDARGGAASGAGSAGAGRVPAQRSTAAEGGNPAAARNSAASTSASAREQAGGGSANRGGGSAAAGSANRDGGSAAAGSANRGGGSAAAGSANRSGGSAAAGSANRGGGSAAAGSAFDGYGSGRQTQVASSRGAASRNSAAGGGARAGGGGGGGGGGGRGR